MTLPNARPAGPSDAETRKRLSRLSGLLPPKQTSQSLPYLHSLLWVAAANAVSFLLFQPWMRRSGEVDSADLGNVAMVYLIAVVLVAAKFGRGPSVLATAMGLVTYSLFLVTNQLQLYDFRYVPTFLGVLFVGLIVSAMTSQLRTEAAQTQQREKRSQALYLLSRGLATAEGRGNIATVVREDLRSTFGASGQLLEWTPTGLVPCPRTGVSIELTPEELSRAEIALRERTVYDTGRLLFMPMVVANVPVGVLCCLGLDDQHLASAANFRLLEAFANNAAVALHRLMVGDDARATQLRADEERLRNVMLSSMSHDFRTPLASITGAVTTLIDNAHKIDEPTKMDLMHSIREDAEFLERQIRNMLDLTKLEAGNLRVHRELHPVDEVVGGAMTRAEKMLEGRRVDIDVSPDLPMIAIDALLIEQLLVNLIENSARHAPSWSPIEVAAHQVGDNIRLQVADRGPGIPRGQHERVFEKFHRVGNSSRSGGAGLGLAICKAIAQLHGGRIWVEDRDGGGALFQVEIPIGEDVVEDEPLPEPEPTPTPTPAPTPAPSSSGGLS